MLNLIKKDILIQKKYMLFAFLYTALFSITFSSYKPIGIGVYVLAPLIVTFFIVTNAMNYDDKNKSEIILNSLPLERTDIVISKYISIFVCVTIGIIYSILVGFIGKTIGRSRFTGRISLVDIVIVLTSVCIVGSIMLPPYFKFGYIKTRIFNTIMLMMIFFVPMLLIQYATKNPNNIFTQKINYFITNTSSFTLNSLALITGLILLLISLMISIHIYNNKEL